MVNQPPAISPINTIKLNGILAGEATLLFLPVYSRGELLKE